MAASALDLSCSVVSSVINVGFDLLRTQCGESRVGVGARKPSSGLVKAINGDKKAVGSTSRWVYRGKQLISQTVFQPLHLPPKADGPWRKDLLEIIADVSAIGNAGSVLQPWILVLSAEEWNKIVLEVGNRDWNLAMDVVNLFKEQSPLALEAQSEDIQDFPDRISENFRGNANGTVDGSKPGALLKMYTTLVGVLGRKGRLSEIQSLLHDIREENVSPDLRFYNGVLEAYSNFGLVSHVSQVVGQMEDSGINPDRATYELMINAALRAKTPQLGRALQVFRNMLENRMEVGVKTYIKLIEACGEAGDIVAADEVFVTLRSSGHTIYSKTWVKMIQLHASVGAYKEAEEIFRALRAARIPPTAAVYDGLLLAYCQAGCLDQAFSVFREYKLATKPSLIAYNYLIEASGKAGRYDESVSLYTELCNCGLRPSAVTFTSLICSTVQAGHYEKADRLYKKMLQKKVTPNAYTYTAMIRAYTACSWTRLGHEVIFRMREEEIPMGALAYGAMLHLYLHGRWFKEAAGIIKEMDRKGIEPDVAGYGALISSLGETGDEIIPVIRAMQASDWELCWVATFLVNSPSAKGGLEPEAGFNVALEKVWGYFEEWATFKDKEANRSFFNATMDALWRRGLRKRARMVMLKARDLLPWYNRPRYGSTSVLDLRGLSVGGAQVALLDWLENVSEHPEESEFMVIQTGSNEQVIGKSNISRGKGVGVVKQAVTAYLEEMCSPFAELPELGQGKLHARTMLVVQWLSLHDSKDALSFHD